MKATFMFLAIFGTLSLQACALHTNEGGRGMASMAASHVPPSQAAYAAEARRLAPLAAQGDAEAQYQRTGSGSLSTPASGVRTKGAKQ